MNDYIFGLSVKDFSILLSAFTAVIIPFILAWLPVLKWSGAAKFALVLVLSLVGGVLTIAATGSLRFVPGSSIIQLGAEIAVASQAFYYVAFRTLGLERYWFPKQALANQAQDSVKVQVADTITHDDASRIIDPNLPPALDVTAKIVNNPGDVIPDPDKV